MPDADRENQLSSVPTVEVVPGGRVEGVIRPPGSKSLTNRALLCAAFAPGVSRLTGALRSEDTEVMLDALDAIGVGVEAGDGGESLRVEGRIRPVDPGSEKPIELFVANSGTTIRFLTAALSAAGGHYLLRGVERMHQRPIADLTDAIRPVLAGAIETISSGGCPPVRIDSSGWRGDTIEVAGSVSSQYLSGLMMAAPISSSARRGDRSSTRIVVLGELVSRPYVDMTAAVMRSFGAEVTLVTDNLDENQSIAVEIGEATFQPIEYAIEPDASAASYFWAAAAISGGRVRVAGLTRGALQGDVQFCEVLEQMGCAVDYGAEETTVKGGHLRGVDVDMNHISDTVQTIAVVALFADGPTRVRGVAHNRFKETDRIGDLACELRKLGAEVDEHDDGMTITPPRDRTRLHGATLETYHDHRMAMSLSLAGLRITGVKIKNPACTSKTYPEFFADLEQLIGRAHRWAS